jgi:vitamin B12 transporter
MKMKKSNLLLMFALALLLCQPPTPSVAADEVTAAEGASAPPDGNTFRMEAVVVSATRSKVKKEEIPSVVEVVTPLDLETAVDANLTRILKKNSSVDVIDYPGVLSGIGIRGFRPEYSGITKHSLVLIDGRPAGAENIATILKSNVARIEVLKGPASALYGAEAMGGVVNIITKKSTGEIESALTVGGGSFETHYESASSGGAVGDKFDYDISVGNKDQNDDFTMGDGNKRENTSFQEMNAALRLGSFVSDILRVDIKGDWYGGRDIMSPNAQHYGNERPSEKDIDRFGGDLNLKAVWGSSETRLTLYGADEAYETSKHYRGEAPYKSYETETEWLGAQLSHTYGLAAHDLIAGIDYQTIAETSKSYNDDGTRKAPYSPDNGRDNTGVYGDAFLRFFDAHLILNTGLRYDKFDLETKQTPYKTDFTAGTESFDIVNPRAGIKYFVDRDRRVQLHATIGTAFVPPEAAQMVGYSERELSDGTIMYTRGNPDLDPEKSLTYDGGVTLQHQTFGFMVDLTYFHTDVDDKITEKAVSETEKTYANAYQAEMRGLEWTLSEDFGTLLDWGRSLAFYFNGTYFFKAEEEVAVEEEGGVVDVQWRDIHNVARTKFNTGLTYDDQQFFGKFNVRYIGKRKDKDWYAAGYPEIEYDDFTICDLSAGVRFKKHHKIGLNVENIFNADYFEKPEYPMPGRAFYADYTYTF